MNCEDMVNMPELTGDLNLKAGEFRVIEFAYHNDRQSHHDDSLTAGQAVRRIINTEFSYYLSENILVQLQTGTVLALVPSVKISDEKLKEILGRIVDVAKNQYHTELYVGVGNSTGYLEDVRVSRNEAAAAIKVADISKADNHIYFYRDQGLYTLISKITDDKFLDEFVEKNIGKLIHADEVNDGNLCETLENYLNHNCNVKYTAECMYIHRNTLNYRLDKIQEILGKEFDDLESCLTLKLAFMIRNYHNVHSA